MEQRLVVVLCMVEERTSREAAEIMSIPEATVRTRLFHARQKLRDGFEKEMR
jgi:RNA polymerase sigma-70 factor (ECF subfamily)